MPVPEGSNRAAFRAISASSGKPGASSKVAYTASDAASGSLVAGLVYRLVATTNCHVNVNAAAVADGSCMYIPLGVPTFIVLDKRTAIAAPVLHAIQDSAGGNLFITQMTEVSV
jgi:hypothetical protein